ncbi:MAG: fumarylacetoacetase [Phycisphaeraceae bacterium]|nr:fumarylacetoacetase [Phycisphaeraceae bacterium]
MPYGINETHDPNLKSWVESANDPSTDFPIQNLPLCTFTVDEDHKPRAATRIGDHLLDLTAAEHLLGSPAARDDAEDHSFEGGLFGLLCQAPRIWASVRARLINLLSDDRHRAQLEPHLRAADAVSCQVPCQVHDYSDFYASLFHATNVGSMFRPDNPLLPNYKHVPIGYHGRASSIVPSGAPIRRPRGQLPPASDGAPPTFGPCAMLDYELEVGCVISRGNVLGEPIDIADTEDHILGLCLVNDWSARDMQRWEYQPLGPFLAKSFATSVSPYIVTMEALAPFRCVPTARPKGDPEPLPYLTPPSPLSAFDITLEVFLASADMRTRSMPPLRLSRGSFRDMYWSFSQMIAHHTSNGCNLQPGDLLASGTVSGPTRDARGCLLELTWNGDPWAKPPVVVPGTNRTPITLPTGEQRKFLADGDEVILRASCEKDGFRRIGFGECRGIIQPAREG